MRFAPACLLSALLALLPARAQDFSKVEIQATRLSDSVYMLTGAGGNMGLSIGNDTFLIDDQYAPLSARIAAAIAKVTPRPVKFIINTHWHGDHVGSNEDFGKAGAIIVSHENVRKRLSADQTFMGRSVPAAAPGALPVVTFASAVTFFLNGDEIRVIHAPNAHTDGDAIVHFLKSDVIHMGDIYWNGLYPIIDFSNGGDPAGVIGAVDKVLAIASDKTKIIPGHGPLSDKAGLKAYRDMLATITGRVKEQIGRGRKLEEITAAGVTAEYDEQWGKRFMNGAKFVEMLVVGLAQRAP